MTRMKDFNIIEFLGINEHGGDFAAVDSHLLPNEARRLEAFRPDGGLLRKVLGNSVDSSFGYKRADRPVTLIRWAWQAGSTFFMMTAWDNVFQQNAGLWEALLTDSDTGNFDPGNLLYYLNLPFDWIVYDDVLYLTDGYNPPLKFDGSKIGTWGLKQFTSATDPIECHEQIGGGGLTNDTYFYHVSLYDSDKALEGMTADPPVSMNVAAAGKVWVHITITAADWLDDDNYDFKNAHADQVRVYRYPNNAGAGTDRYLAGTMTKGLVTKAGTIRVEDATGVVTGIGTDWREVSVGDCLYVNATRYRVSVANGVADDNVGTIVESNSAAYDDNDLDDADWTFIVVGGFLDSDDDITGNLRYFNDTDSEDERYPPERCKYCAVFGGKGNKAFMAGDPAYPNRVYYSKTGYPDYWAIEAFIDIDPDDSDAITGLIKFQGRLFVFKRNSVAIANVDGDPYTWTHTAKALSVGASERRCIADCGGLLIFANTTGVYSFDGSNLVHISHLKSGSNIRLLWEFVVKKELARAQAIFHKDRQEYWISVCFDDARGLYDDTKAGLGDIEEYDATPPV